MNQVYQIEIAKASYYRTHGFDLDAIKRSYESFIFGISEGSLRLRPTSFIFKNRGRAIDFILEHNTSEMDFERMVGKDWIEFEYSLVKCVELYD